MKGSPDVMQDLSPAEMAVALADVRDEMEVLGRSRWRQLSRIAAWATGGGFLLLAGAMLTSAPLAAIGLVALLAAASKCPSYLKKLSRWRELTEARKSLQLVSLQVPSSDP